MFTENFGDSNHFSRVKIKGKIYVNKNYGVSDIFCVLIRHSFLQFFFLHALLMNCKYKHKDDIIISFKVKN